MTISALLSHRYEILTPNAIPKGFMDGKQACERMVPLPFPAAAVVLGRFTVYVLAESQIMCVFANSSYSDTYKASFLLEPLYLQVIH